MSSSTPAGYRRILCALVPLAMVIAAVGGAQAQAPADGSGDIPAARPRAPQSSERWSQSGLKFSGGAVFTPGLTPGFYARLEFDALTPLVGVTGISLDFWKAKDDWGIGGPSGIYIWYPISLGHGDAPAIFTSLEGGWNWFLMDRVNGEYQMGIFTPSGSASLGLMMKRWRAVVDGRAEYRWHLTGDNRAQYRAGFAFILELDG